MKKVLISHFYNEEYLLPYWLKHHREIFDHGVLINNHSTDLSHDICRDLVPGWEIARSTNETFSGIMCDFEVMRHEARFKGDWKLVLNTTEFLVGSQIDNVITFMTNDDYIGGRIPGAVMVDSAPGEPLDPERALVAQKHHGAWEAGFDYAQLGQSWYDRPTRSRILHNYPIGAYKPGRHESHLPGLVDIKPEHLGIWWYGYSPWTPEGIARKLQIRETIDPFDTKIGFGHQHQVSAEEIEARHKTMLEFATDLGEPALYQPV